jgi:hypothetical protein
MDTKTGKEYEIAKKQLRKDTAHENFERMLMSNEDFIINDEYDYEENPVKEDRIFERIFEPDDRYQPIVINNYGDVKEKSEKTYDKYNDNKINYKSRSKFSQKKDNNKLYDLIEYKNRKNKKDNAKMYKQFEQSNLNYGLPRKDKAITKKQPSVENSLLERYKYYKNKYIECKRENEKLIELVSQLTIK